MNQALFSNRYCYNWATAMLEYSARRHWPGRETCASARTGGFEGRASRRRECATLRVAKGFWLWGGCAHL